MDQYYAVVYCKDGTIHLLPADSKEEAVDRLKQFKESEKISERMEHTTIMKRNMDNFKDGLIFGCPKCFDVAGGK